MDVFNLFDGATETPADPNDPQGYACSAVRVGPKIGASKLGMSIYELPAGQAICPYHFEWTDEEWLIVLEGQATLRTAEGEHELEAGETLCFPAGPEGAHQVRNASDAPVRVAILSTKNEFGIVEYPEIEQVGIWAGDEHYVLDRRRV